MTNGAGNYCVWVNGYYQYRGYRTQLGPTSGSMGYGTPAAVAAKLVHPERTVVAFAGDGCLLMTGQELATAAQYGLRIVWCVVNNGMYGTIRMHQERDYPGRVVGTDLEEPRLRRAGARLRRPRRGGRAHGRLRRRLPPRRAGPDLRAARPARRPRGGDAPLLDQPDPRRRAFADVAHRRRPMLEGRCRSPRRATTRPLAAKVVGRARPAIRWPDLGPIAGRSPPGLIRPRCSKPIVACGQRPRRQAGQMTAGDRTLANAKNACPPGQPHMPRAARRVAPRPRARVESVEHKHKHKHKHEHEHEHDRQGRTTGSVQRSCGGSDRRAQDVPARASGPRVWRRRAHPAKAAGYAGRRRRPRSGAGSGRSGPA